MLKYNRFGTELYPSTMILAVGVGRSYRTAQRNLHKLLHEDKVLILIRPANEPAALHNGEFRPTNTYKIAADNLQPRESVEEWEAAGRALSKHKGRRPMMGAIEKPVLAETSARAEATAPGESPAPEVRPAPSRSFSDHRFTRDERLAIYNCYSVLKRSGMTHPAALAEVRRQFKEKFSADEIEFALRIVSHKNGGGDVIAEMAPVVAKQNPHCFTCEDSGEIWNKGPGPRKIPCPNCRRDRF